MYITVYRYTYTDIHSSNTRSTPPSCRPAPYRATGKDTPDYSSFPPHCTLIHCTCHAYAMYITVYSYTQTYTALIPEVLLQAVNRPPISPQERIHRITHPFLFTVL